MPSPSKITDTEKWCNRCKRWLPHSAFYTHKGTRGRGLSSYCKACYKEWGKGRKEYKRQYGQSDEGKAKIKEWRKANAERVRAKEPQYKRKLRYGITPEMYAELWNAQNGRCYLPSCGRPAEVVDHDHDTGEVRGLLCRQCNTALGMLRDNPALMRDAAAYIESFRGLSSRTQL